MVTNHSNPVPVGHSCRSEDLVSSEVPRTSGSWPRGAAGMELLWIPPCWEELGAGRAVPLLLIQR